MLASKVEVLVGRVRIVVVRSAAWSAWRMRGPRLPLAYANERDRDGGEGKGHTPMRVTFWMDEDILNAGGCMRVLGELGKIYELI